MATRKDAAKPKPKTVLRTQMFQRAPTGKTLKRGSSKSKVTRANPGDGYAESTIKTPKTGSRMAPVYTEAGKRGPSGNMVVTKKGKTTRVARPGGRGQTVTQSYTKVPKRGKGYSKTTTTSARVSRLGAEGPKRRTIKKK